MNKIVRKLISLELALKNIIPKLRNDGLKKATGKSESHFRKCSDENDYEHNLYHMDSVLIDIESLKNGYGTPMLNAHNEILQSQKYELNDYENIADTLIGINIKLGNLQNITQQSISPSSESGSQITDSEKNKISRAIKDVEDQILELKKTIDKQK